MIQEIKSLITELFELLGIEAQFEVTEEEENKEKIFIVKILSEKESGLLIGVHGMTLTAIQSFIAIALKQKTGEWARVNVDIADWRLKQDEQLENLAIQTAERVRSTNEPQSLYNLTPSQRRIIHLKLSTFRDITTESVGEGSDRYLVVKTKS